MRTLADRIFESQRQGRSEAAPPGIDANRIVRGLWMGSRPLAGRAVSEAGFDLLVLCAEEYQPPAWQFPGVSVVHAPFDDNEFGPTPQEQKIAQRAAEQVASHLRDGAKVLVTCFAGRNRSGLVCALAMVENGHDPLRAIRLIQSRRKQNALSNQHFVDLIAGT